MITTDSLDNIPIALAIGTFDGVHLGHQYIFKELKKHGIAAVLTFSNHPSQVLHASNTTPLCSLEEKLRLFEMYGIDLTIVLPFTDELAKTPYDVFLKKIHSRLPFTHLIRGEGSVLGYQAQGNQERITALAQEMNFTPIYLPKFVVEGEAVSSRRIRELIKTGNTEQAHRLLGRGASW